MSSSTTAEAKHPAIVTTGLVVVSVIFLALSLAAIGLRFRARRVARQTLKFDDFWIIIAWVAAFGMSIDIWVFSRITGINYYKDGVGFAYGTEKSIEVLFISTLLLQVAITTVKISILLFYKSIFITRGFKLAVWVAIVVIPCWGILFFFLVLFQSNPVEASWTGEGRLVIDSTSMGLAQVGSSIGLDVVILCFPLPMIYNLHLTMKRKIQVILIFWLGAFCCAAAIVRLVFYNEAIREVQGSSGFDKIYLLSNDLIFQLLESNCSIIAACLPTLAPLLAKGHRLESFVRGVRSFTSLGSRKSNTSSAGSSATSSKIQDGTTKSSTQIEQTSDDAGYRAWMDSSENEKQQAAPEDGKITVTRTVDVSSV